MAFTCSSECNCFPLTDCDRAAEDMPELSDGDDDEYDGDEEQWQCMDEEEEEYSQTVTCLFCDR